MTRMTLLWSTVDLRYISWKTKQEKAGTLAVFMEVPREEVAILLPTGGRRRKKCDYGFKNHGKAYFKKSWQGLSVIARK